MANNITLLDAYMQAALNYFAQNPPLIHDHKEAVQLPVFPDDKTLNAVPAPLHPDSGNWPPGVTPPGPGQLPDPPHDHHHHNHLPINKYIPLAEECRKLAEAMILVRNKEVPKREHHHG